MASVRVAVEDNGPGVPRELRERVFEPFFTTKPAGVDAGVGLAICRRFTSDHGGTIRVEDAPAGGAAFVLELPAAEPAREDLSASAPRLG